MDSIIDNTNGKKTKKELRKSIAVKLESGLEEFRNGMKEKKFKAAVKRASKLLANDLFVRNKKKKPKPENNLNIVEEIGA